MRRYGWLWMTSIRMQVRSNMWRDRIVEIRSHSRRFVKHWEMMVLVLTGQPGRNGSSHLSSNNRSPKDLTSQRISHHEGMYLRGTVVSSIVAAVRSTLTWKGVRSSCISQESTIV